MLLKLIELVKLLFAYKKNKQQEKENCSGSIHIEYDKTTGNFSIESSVSDLSDASAQVLALLLLHLVSGNLEKHIYESLTLWAGDNEEKRKFNQLVATYIEQFYNNLQSNNSQDDSVAVDPLNVFNHKE